MCPDCAHNTPVRTKDTSIVPHVSWEYILESALYLKGCKIKLTGGEPTIHPDFPDIAKHLKKIFNTPSLEMDTNGFNCLKYFDYLEYFDKICFSHYIKGDFFTEKEDNTNILNALKENKNIKLEVFDIDFFHRRGVNTKSKPCYRSEIETISYMDGLLFPCCIGLGNENAVGIKPSENWRKEILDVPFKCNNCLFAVE